ncbi:phosphatase PAP2 family protein [Candidatus Gottesmanbacteria bacterium]|nr:phosphatase PAP2 family protein [Candidatus Gottesmanbacteria bacterium]
MPKLKDNSKRYIFVALVAAYALFIYVGRVYLGQHWLSDIIGGLLLGLSTSFLAVSLVL